MDERSSRDIYSNEVKPMDSRDREREYHHVCSSNLNIISDDCSLLEMETNSTDSNDEKTSFECLSSEMIMSVFDYLTKIEVLVAFFQLNQRFRSIIFNYLHSDYRLTQFHLNHTDYSLYQRFSREILPSFQSTITALELGSSYHYGQIEEFQCYQLTRLDALTIHLIDSKKIFELLEQFLSHNQLAWFDQIRLISDEETQGWNEKQPFCVQNIPVRQLVITGRWIDDLLYVELLFSPFFFRKSALCVRSASDDSLLSYSSANDSSQIWSW